MTKNLNRILVYSVSTDAFFKDDEHVLATKKLNSGIKIKNLESIRDTENPTEKFIIKYETLINEINQYCSQNNVSFYPAIDLLIEIEEENIKELQGEIGDLLASNLDKDGSIRTLRRDALYINRKFTDAKGNVTFKEVNKSKKVVALFESAFTRKLQLSKDKVNEDVVIIKTYHYKLLERLIKQGFIYNDEKYIIFSSSSGQMKNKKCVFVKESLWNEHKEAILCGMDWDRINSKEFKKGDKVEYGININKYLAYLSLQNSSTQVWEGFDINRVVVCPDLEINVKGIVEYIDRDTYELYPPEEKELPMNVSDGVGLILPDDKLSKNFQFRIPFGKGLLSQYNFLEHAKKLGKYEITDVWGKKHHIINDDVQIILSASQLKTWKYYNSMDEYRQLFIESGCEAGICNTEVDTKYIQSNYQYLQSLTGTTYDELEEIAKLTNEDIASLGQSQEIMLRALGATDENEKKDAFQEALLLYPNLLNDTHSKKMISKRKESMVNDGRGGTLRLEGKRKFVLPDLYAYCGFLLTGDKNSKGLLPKNTVFAKDMSPGTVDILRSPQLYREHGIRELIHNNKLKKWYKTGAIYVSNADFLSRLLQMDFDGDVVNVCAAGSKFVSIAERHMEGIYPLYYEMSTAPIQKISHEAIYKSLIDSFDSSIGNISNSITKIWNSGEFNEDKLNAIKLKTMYNNFMIDKSKTNFLPKAKGKVKEEMNRYSPYDQPMPYFYYYAKGVEIEKVASKVIKEEIKDESGEVIEEKEYTPVVNMLEDIIKSPRITFRKVAEKFDYTVLMSVAKFKSNGKDVDDFIIDTYKSLNKNKKWKLDKDCDDYKENKYTYLARLLKEEMFEGVKKNYSKITEEYIINALVYYLHNDNKSLNKKTLWECYGEEILANMVYKLNKIRTCKYCEGEFKVTNHKERYCSEECATEGEKIMKIKGRKK